MRYLPPLADGHIMMQPIIDHIGTTVRDMTVAVPFCPPRKYPEHTPPGYYALFFKDPEGIKYQMVCVEHGDRRS